jgi:23S rRNA (cytidine2498-2'-O)-methyltransferase
MHICITRDGQEDYAARELTELPTASRVECTRLAAGVVELSGVTLETLYDYPLFFTRQLLPQPIRIEATSIRLWAQAISQHLIEALTDSLTTWSLYVFEPQSAETGEQYSRQRLITEEVFAHLKQRRRSLLRRHTDKPERDTIIAQVVTLSSELGFMSITASDIRHSLRSSLVPHLAGYVSIPDDAAPPSRAFKKLREALALFGLTFIKGQTCVDLGAAPGGWTHVLITHGCHVTAVDRSQLDERLMRNKLVSFVKGNALTWLPEQTVDWLVCDVITTPDRTTELLSTWLTRKLCRNFCVTIKFKGEPDFASLTAVRELLARHCSWWDGKQLTHNKNELTVVGRLA